MRPTTIYTASVVEEGHGPASPRRARRWRSMGLTLLSTTVLAVPLSAQAGIVPAAVPVGAYVAQGHGPDPWDPYGGGPSGSGTAAVDSTPATTAQSAGIVLIDTTLAYEQAEGAGTGMVLTSSGKVLTNYHVVEGASSIRVTVATTGKTYRAKIVGSDQTDDVAVLQLQGASGLTAIKVDDDPTKVGDAVTAVGNAGGTGDLSSATGSITSLKASVTTAAEGSVASETLRTMIETDADVVPGDSGGPLLDADGEVVGIDTAASTGSEIDGYAIPIERALAVVDQIRSGQESSTVRIGAAAFLGVELSADPYSTGGWGADDTTWSTSGASVGDVVAGQPAARAGLAAGDTITRIGSRAISSASDLSAALAGYQPGDSVKVTWIDGSGQQHAATVTLAASPVA